MEGTDSPIVEFMVRFCVVNRLLAEHVDDGTGHCRACPIGNQAGYQSWPCRLHYYAALADEVARAAGIEPKVAEVRMLRPQARRVDTVPRREASKRYL